jgi:preprotein translocase subunit YajC
MLVIHVKDGEQIDRALKRLKRKFLQTGTLKKLRAKKQYLKPTERNRIKMQKATYSVPCDEIYGVIMDTLSTFMFPMLIIGIFYLLVFRPQQKKMKEHQSMVNNLAKGDEVVTAGGLIGKVTKVKADSNEIEVELAKDIRVNVVQATVADVRSKSKPAS